jgi:hypothetical protein
MKYLAQHTEQLDVALQSLERGVGVE